MDAVHEFAQIQRDIARLQRDLEEKEQDGVKRMMAVAARFGDQDKPTEGEISHQRAKISDQYEVLKLVGDSASRWTEFSRKRRALDIALRDLMPEFQESTEIDLDCTDILKSRIKGQAGKENYIAKFCEAAGIDDYEVFLTYDENDEDVAVVDRVVEDRTFCQVYDDEEVLIQDEVMQNICPFTKTIITEPVKSRRCGHIYSKTGMEWFLQQKKRGIPLICPVAGCSAKIKPGLLTPKMSAKFLSLH
jgi:hypothetical protein